MKSAIRISLTYAAIAAIWIIFSDKIASLLSPSVAALTVLSSVKGILFVLVTGGILYVQIQKEIERRNVVIQRLDRDNEIQEDLIRELHHRVKNNIQVFLSLLNIEASAHSNFREIQERLSNKLLSMMSIFNLVYDMHDMTRISLQEVLEEYSRISTRNIRLRRVQSNDIYTLKTISSCMLLVDSLLEVYFKNNTKSEQVEISNVEYGRIEMKYVDRIETSIAKEDKEFIDLFLKSIAGDLRNDEETETLIVTFKNR